MRPEPPQRLRGVARWGLILLVAGLPLFRGGASPAGELFARVWAW